MTTPTPHGATVHIIEPPEFAPRPSITESMSKDALWSYACLVGYRYKLSEHDREQSARAAIQQSAGAVPEGWQDLIDELETAAGRITQYSNSPLDGLLQAAADALRTASPAIEPPKQQPDHLGSGECGGVQAMPEPVGEVFTMMALPHGEEKCHVQLRKTLPRGTLLYTHPERLTDSQIDDLWLYRDCIKAIQAGNILAQVRCVVRAAIAKAQGGAA